ncbi:MAG: hypothetical protein Q9220_007481 [cf. Caloplaca sp. 1 TL-2023]
MTTALPSLADPTLPSNLPSQPPPLPLSPSAANTTNPPSPTTSIPWGPSHPCFPHPNPHLPPSSPLSTSTRIIRIPRDWSLSGDLYPQYSNTYPEILSPWVSEPEFRELVQGVNEGLMGAYDTRGWRSWVELGVGVGTGWVWESLFGGWKGKAGARGVEAWVREWNEKVGKKEGGEGVGCLDIQIPDPQVRVMGSMDEEQEEEEEEEGQQHSEPTEKAASMVKGAED